MHVFCTYMYPFLLTIYLVKNDWFLGMLVFNFYRHCQIIVPSRYINLHPQEQSISDSVQYLSIPIVCSLEKISYINFTACSILSVVSFTWHTLLMFYPEYVSSTFLYINICSACFIDMPWYHGYPLTSQCRFG